MADNAKPRCPACSNPVAPHVAVCPHCRASLRSAADPGLTDAAAAMLLRRGDAGEQPAGYREARQFALATLAIGCAAFAVWAFVLVPIGRAWNADTRTAEMDNKRAAQEAITPRDGKRMKLDVGSFVADSWEHLQRAEHLRSVSDWLGLSAMQADGQCWTMTAATDVLVIDAGMLGSEVRIESGEHRGKSGWTANEFLRE